MSPRLNIVTVKYGTAYPADYVNRMFSMLRRHLDEDFDAWCITEDPRGLEASIKPIKPLFNVPGWWNKLFLFSPAMPEGEILYLDLDQIITGDISPLLAACRKSGAKLCAYRDPLQWQGSAINSSWLYFRHPDLAFIYDAFVKDLPGVLTLEGGDQLYIWRHMKDVYFVDDVLPNGIKSFKFQLCKITGQTLNVPLDIDPAVRVINFHGRPKPHELMQVPWVQQHWH
ncbi:hypothetical protein [Parvibaculum sp.]|uniref:hypothetical protein n=1 Tax=Parvibaculum sp. TaxID=2024848 RepID=UPI002CDAF633|nr:hypothetical protein [Parvibaculum sp.]HUD53045.1 hypothetical protein [Parvibaculum sp.]